MSQPFITLYTPTYRRPKALARCLKSVQIQTAVEAIQHIVIPDHIGLGVGGMYTKVPDYIHSVHGEYVHILCDDDQLETPTVVAEVRDFARAHGNPPVIVVDVNKGGFCWPAGDPWPPQMGAIDLGCCITRADVWKAHVADYQPIYEGDWTFMDAVCRSGHQAAYCEVLFLRGAVSRGAAEAVA